MKAAPFPKSSSRSFMPFSRRWLARRAAMDLSQKQATSNENEVFRKKFTVTGETKTAAFCSRVRQWRRGQTQWEHGAQKSGLEPAGTCGRGEESARRGERAGHRGAQTMKARSAGRFLDHRDHRRQDATRGNGTGLGNRETRRDGVPSGGRHRQVRRQTVGPGLRSSGKGPPLPPRLPPRPWPIRHRSPCRRASRSSCSTPSPRTRRARGFR